MGAHPIPDGDARLTDAMRQCIDNLRTEAVPRDPRRPLAPTPGYRAAIPPTVRCWEEFEARKRALPPMSGEDYDDAVRVILAELGL